VWNRIRHATLYFLLGFTVAFVIYLFIRFNADQVLVGMALGSAVGVLVAALLLWLEYRYPDQPRA
jgi:VanZ family protein